MNNKKEKTYINEKKAKFKNKQQLKQENNDLHKQNLQKSKHKHKYKKKIFTVNNENINENINDNINVIDYEIGFHDKNDIDEQIGFNSSNNEFYKKKQCIYEYETQNRFIDNETKNILNNIFKNSFEYNPFIRQTKRLNIFIQLSNGYSFQDYSRLPIFRTLSEYSNYK